MKSVKKSLQPEPEFPCLMVHRESGAVFLMSSLQIGFCVYSSNMSSYTLGGKLSNGDAINITFFHGTIELSN